MLCPARGDGTRQEKGPLRMGKLRATISLLLGIFSPKSAGPRPRSAHTDTGILAGGNQHVPVESLSLATPESLLWFSATPSMGLGNLGCRG